MTVPANKNGIIVFLLFPLVLFKFHGFYGSLAFSFSFPFPLLLFSSKKIYFYLSNLIFFFCVILFRRLLQRI